MLCAAAYYRRRFKDAHEFAISSCYFACICGAVNAGNLNIVVTNSRNNLNSLKILRQDNHIAACCIGLWVKDVANYLW